jgi:hypothetical protein
MRRRDGPCDGRAFTCPRRLRLENGLAMFALASLNFRDSRMLAGLLLAGLLPVAAIATWLTASGPALRATGPAPPTRAGPRCLQRGPSHCRHRGRARAGLGERGGSGWRRKRIPRRLLRNLSRWGGHQTCSLGSPKRIRWSGSSSAAGERFSGPIDLPTYRPNRYPNIVLGSGATAILAPIRDASTVALTMTGGTGAALLLHVRAYLGGTGQLPRNARQAGRCRRLIRLGARHALPALRVSCGRRRRSCNAPG